MDKAHREKNLILVSVNLKSPQPDLPTNLQKLRIPEERSRCVRCSAFALPPRALQSLQRAGAGGAGAGEAPRLGRRTGRFAPEKSRRAQGRVAASALPEGRRAEPRAAGQQPRLRRCFSEHSERGAPLPGDTGHSPPRRGTAPKVSGRRPRVTREWTLATVIFHPSCIWVRDFL